MTQISGLDKHTRVVMINPNEDQWRDYAQHCTAAPWMFVNGKKITVHFIPSSQPLYCLLTTPIPWGHIFSVMLYIHDWFAQAFTTVSFSCGGQKHIFWRWGRCWLAVSLPWPRPLWMVQSCSHLWLSSWRRTAAAWFLHAAPLQGWVSGEHMEDTEKNGQIQYASLPFTRRMVSSRSPKVTLTVLVWVYPQFISSAITPTAGQNARECQQFWYFP